MGQAAVDLPDPSEVPAAPASSADDLLAQMAGEEIDRLLAEAEVEKAKDPAPPEPQAPAMPEPPAPTPQDSLNESDTAAQIDALFEEATAEKQTAEKEKPAAPAAAPAAVEKQSDDAAAIQSALLDDPKPAPVKTAPVKTAPVKTGSLMPGAVIEPEPAPAEIPDLKAEAKQLDEALAKGSTDALPEVKALEAETSSAEKNALADAIESLDAPADPAAAQLVADDAPIPFYLKPLVWLNFPMELLPPAAREAIGKVALMTLANSVAILAYVLFFRKHH